MPDGHSSIAVRIDFPTMEHDPDALVEAIREALPFATVLPMTCREVILNGIGERAVWWPHGEGAPKPPLNRRPTDKLPRGYYWEWNAVRGDWYPESMDTLDTNDEEG